MFTGRRFDNESGLYYYRARYYRPDLGRFLQPDPIGYDDGMNIYAYCNNNPLIFVDPYGLDRMGIHADKSHAWITMEDSGGNISPYGLWLPSYDKLAWLFGAKDGLGGERLKVFKSKTYLYNSGTNVFVLEDGLQTAVFKGREESLSAIASRYYDLNESQTKKAYDFLTDYHRYTYFTNNCASYASDAVWIATGEDVDADSWLLGIETVDELRKSIQKLNEADTEKK